MALIPKERAENEGQLRPIAILPSVYRVWMAVRKRRVKDWVRGLHGGTIKPSWIWFEVAARAEVSKPAVSTTLRTLTVASVMRGFDTELWWKLL